MTPWTAAHQASLSNSRSLLKLVSIQLVIASNHLILCCPLLLLPSVFPSIGVFSDESVLHIRWPKYWSFSFNISPSSESSGLISFRMDWLDLLAVQGTLKSLLQHHSPKASVLWCSAFFCRRDTVHTQGVSPGGQGQGMDDEYQPHSCSVPWPHPQPCVLPDGDILCMCHASLTCF